ncbi:hypothetical protein CTAYLR_009586 [Chrysophaeum taylorii]|uniref:SDR family oxidoreductase n=1 Tax=Chrysophaeum taylorii TaxID=2483200 RepID=A0AAD7XKY0_9STRA|nr:hypothetical protein CTAYLR_009586 [Chrysophaeum taylorii]
MLPEGISPEALKIAIEVVERCGALAKEEYLGNSELRPLRAALTPLVWACLERSYEGDKAAARKAHRRALNREKQRAAALERAAADRCALRQARLERLARHQSLVADGPCEAVVVPEIESSPATASRSLASCYSCRARFGRREAHAFYGDAFCPECAALNWSKRAASCDMRGRTAVVTGARVKIGFYVALKLLRAGARVVVTTRFAGDALDRYARESDYEEFRNRLEIVGCDFRDLRAVEALAKYLDERLAGLDVLVNNACQTVRRPKAYYAAALTREAPRDHQIACFGVRDDDREDDGAGIVQVGGGMMVDARKGTSWNARLADVSLVEAAECFAINVLAPLSLCARLKPALLRARAPRFVVMVSAMEGKFNRRKTIYHPHTNAAKAALNMITRTSAADYAADGIYMNAVDTGWVTDERPLEQAQRVARDQGFQTPIDEIDAAARILDPVFSVLRGDVDPYHGLFLKDYRPTEW